VAVVEELHFGRAASRVHIPEPSALGGLYTVFDDLDGLILRVNSGTLKRLETALNVAIPSPAGILLNTPS
jgi:hypothetical protein